MIVKLDHLPKDRGENEEYLKPPPSDDTLQQLGAYSIKLSRWQMVEIFYFWSVLSSYAFLYVLHMNIFVYYPEKISIYHLLQATAP